MSAKESFLVPDQVFDGTSVQAGVAVGVRGNSISRIIPISDLPEHAERRMLPGATLTPGLIDAHVHVAPWSLFGFLAAGVTTVRDLGNDLDRIDAAIASLPATPVPNVVWSGPLLETGPTNWPPLSRSHASPADVRATVDELADRGLRAIKLYYNATPELVIAAAERAHHHGMRVLAHLGVTSLAQAVAAGVDEVQHLSGTTAAEQSLSSWTGAADVVAGYGVDHCPTVNGWDSFANWRDPRSARDSAFEWVHPEALEGWNRSQQASQAPAARLSRQSRILEHMGTIRALIAAGRGILVGSDTPFPGLVPGFSLHDEAGLLVQAGMSPLDAMVAMTSGNASRIGLDAGRIVAGARADIAAFTGDPTRRISDLSEPELVMRDGVDVDLAALRRTRDTVFAQATNSPVDELALLQYRPAAIQKRGAES